MSQADSVEDISAACLCNRDDTDDVAKEIREMFEVGDYVVYGTKGVCRIEDITHIDISGADQDRLYYVLAPVGDASGRIYAPTDNHKIVMRHVISKEEAYDLIDSFPEIGILWVPSEKQREEKYKEAMRTCDYRAWVSIVKTLTLRMRERAAQGKKITALDERYLRAAENELYSELSLALGVPREEMGSFIRERLDAVRI